MVRIEEKSEINATAKTVFNILFDNVNYPRWSMGTEETKQISEGKFLSKSKLGESTATRTEAIPNERLTFKSDGSPFSEVGEVITTKGDGVEVMVWGILRDDSMLEKVRKPTEEFVKSIKNYAEYVESGGNPDEYNKNELSTIQ